ncbi:MAG: aminomethyl-transferring glycine dehydrogenase, partial [Oscillospiraceae bacterium]|nr:aminomethyl-transferring glycine dehydrogenase [Oscillospiraceae bacterium]
HYAASQIGAVPGFDLVHEGPFFHEFVTQCPIAPEVVLEHLAEEEILGGLPLEGEREGQILWCVTEENTKEEIDLLVMRLREVAGR